ncbi:MAG: sigma-54-dependent Fis family transcriptional regulator [Candidatus Aminicenantes bacterium]|nr:sigma-54-dependent Fis family transcriptional regulator [Candidatus Aminicenantes bacterium]
MNGKKFNILIIDDDKKFITEAKKMLRDLGEIDFDEGYSEADFYSLYKPGKYNAIILDLRLKSGYEGMELLEYALNEDPHAPIIVLTGYASIETAVKSLRLGAKDYLEKQYLKEKDFKTEFIKKINRIIIEDKAVKIADQKLAESAAVDRVIGNDIKIKRIIAFAEKFAREKESPILLVGEMGTEKGQVAQYIHRKSSVRGKFVKKVINPGEEDLAAQLFGGDKAEGLIKQAQAGVLYLEDVFRLDYETQQRLLDFFDSGELKKTGKKHGQAVKVQVILSTSRSSDQLITNKNIHANFFYRVKTPEILIPPLRERGDDIFLLSQYYLLELKHLGKTTAGAISNEVLKMFKAYPWPGNLFELKHVIELSGMNARLDNDKTIKPGHLPFDLQNGVLEKPGSAQIDLDKILAETTLKYMAAALKKSKGAKIEAYKYLGYPESKRGTLNTRFKKVFTTYPDLKGKYPGIHKLYLEK